MALVFVSYRTGDAAHVAAAVHERLVSAFGPGQVFRDARSMGPGERYPSTIRSALRRADVVVAVIGPQWLAANEHGQRLVDREWDWVRWEITTAVEFGIPIVPVLVDDTPLPDAVALPGRMAELARFQVARVRHTDQGPDLDRLAAALVERVPALTQSRAPVPIPSTAPRSRMPAGLGVRGRALGISIALVVALVGTAVAAFTAGRNSVDPAGSVTIPNSSSSVTGPPAVPHSLQLLYPDPGKVAEVSWGITVKVKGRPPESHTIWTGYRATDEAGKPTGSHTSMLWVSEISDGIWETINCFGISDKSGALFVVYAYLVPKATDERWRLVEKRAHGILQKAPYELERDGAGEIGQATVRLTADRQCRPAP